LPQVVVFDSKVVVNRIIGVGDPVVQSSFCNSMQSDQYPSPVFKVN
jgi:hypothetical protein